MPGFSNKGFMLCILISIEVILHSADESQTGKFPHQALKKDNDIKSKEKCCSRESEGYSKCGR